MSQETVGAGVWLQKESYPYITSFTFTYKSGCLKIKVYRNHHLLQDLKVHGRCHVVYDVDECYQYCINYTDEGVGGQY